jgi:ribosomal protein S18 acetylase RimI-like enzyme
MRCLAQSPLLRAMATQLLVGFLVPRTTWCRLALTMASGGTHSRRVSYIWVAKEHRRRSIARLLLENALVEAGEHTAFSSFVMDNAASKKLAFAKQQFIPHVRIYHKRLQQ